MLRWEVCFRFWRSLGEDRGLKGEMIWWGFGIRRGDHSRRVGHDTRLALLVLFCFPFFTKVTDREASARTSAQSEY
jgi:hypothetical protein